jgi:hypothetical protein
MKYKLARYHELGVKFISLYPDNLPNLDVVFRKRFREATGVELPGKGRRQKAEGRTGQTEDPALLESRLPKARLTA